MEQHRLPNVGYGATPLSGGSWPTPARSGRASDFQTPAIERGPQQSDHQTARELPFLKANDDALRVVTPSQRDREFATHSAAAVSRNEW